MTNKRKRIYIIGAGQIGSRHLQALKNVHVPLKITVIDPSDESLLTAKERYNSLPQKASDHEVEFLNTIPQIDKNGVDIAIIATYSNVRAEVIKKLINHSRVKYLILEKILFNKATDYLKIEKLLKTRGVKTWVNCPMRIMPVYQHVAQHFRGDKISYIVTGSNFGLITNAIHYLDHAAYLSETPDFELNTSHLQSKSIPSKRKGSIELNGTITASFKNGSNVSLTCYPDGNAPVIVEIHSNKARYIGRESEGRAWLSKADNNWQWKEIKAPIPFQSQLTTAMVEEVLKTGKCNLVPYRESKTIHLNMLEPLLKFINKNTKKKYNFYPFT